MKKFYIAVIIAFGFFIVKLPIIADLVGEKLAQGVLNTFAPALTYYSNIEHHKKVNGFEALRDSMIPAGGYASASMEAIVDYEPWPVNPGETVETNTQPEGKEDIPQKTTGQTIYFKAKQEEKNTGDTQATETVASKNIITGTVYSKQQLANYSFLMSNFYIVTSATELNSSMLKPAQALEMDMSMEKKDGLPQILIFHTHSQETFADSIPGDKSTSIVGVGDYLATILHDKYGYNVYHDTTVYDLVNGKLDRSAAYTYAQENVEKILEKNPSIEVVIDLHRDGVDEKTRLVTEINGKPTAKIMFFNGLSYSKLNGDITYLPNPNRDENLAMSLQMQLLGNAYYPGFLRKIYINSYRYVLHLRGKSTLIEAGAQNNTVAEVKNAMEPLADILDKLLRGEKGYTN